MFRQVYETYHQVKEEHNQQKLLQHSFQQLQEQQKLNTTRQEQAVPFLVDQSPAPEKSTINTVPSFQIYQSPSVNRSMRNVNIHQSPGNNSDGSGEEFLKDLWKTSVYDFFTPNRDAEEMPPVPRRTSRMQPLVEPKGNAMKTPFG